MQAEPNTAQKVEVFGQGKAPYQTPELTVYGDVVKQTTRGHSGSDGSRVGPSV